MNRATVLAVGLVAGLACGCFPQQTNTRGQVADEPTEPDQNATVGQYTVIGNADPIPVYGVGLVHHLNGTGSSPPHDGWRQQLEAAIRKNRGNPKELLDDPNQTTSLVLVSAFLPPGARSNEKLDVAISLPPGSKTKSLKGGILLACDLANQELAANAREALQAAGVPVGKVPVVANGTVLPGSRLAVAEGPLVAGFEGPTKSTEGIEGESPDGPRVARIWGGAKCLLDRPYYFLLNESTPQPRLAMIIAERMNATFHAPGDKTGKLAEAKVQGKPLVVALVPPAYRLNHSRFLLVARQVPLAPVGLDSPYRKQLERELLQPETAIVAALKLEALGADSRQPLRVGLQHESPWVRFAAAEALAYLGHADGAKDLADLAERHPALRSHALLALGSLDDAICLDHLAELLKKPDAQLRYGAFVALRSADENHEAIRGTKVNNSYRLHHVAPDSEPMIHVAANGRAEIALFGTVSPVLGPLSFAIGKDFTISAKENEPFVTVTRMTLKNGEPMAVPVKCRADVAAVLKALGDLGGTFGDAVEFIHRAEKADGLAAAVHYDATPRGIAIQQLAAIARSSDPMLAKADDEVKRIGTVDHKPTSFDVPSEGDAVQAKPAVEDPALSRNPGRIFGPRPAGAEEPGPALSRNPGRLFGPGQK